MSGRNPLAVLVAAVLDEDEQLARLIGHGGFHPQTWHLEPSRSGRWMRVYSRSRMLGDPPEAADHDGDPPVALVTTGRGEHEHIVRHDPSRVLDEVAAKRRVLARHPGATADSECPGCGAHLDGTWVTPPGGTCPELADLAAPYVSPEAKRVGW
ncbi:DUF6221 family protein [Streptosporangium sp. NPDC002524]|uniref:DUF6221 family protein n=1 Tax=Streptosporangium sp. NPDC002524 TaxID=3154537 RepID=UPI0033318D54